jgi:hypothetical protein
MASKTNDNINIYAKWVTIIKIKSSDNATGDCLGLEVVIHENMVIAGD